MPRLGAHMSVAGGLPRAVERAVVHRCDALQIFAKNASQWRGRAAAARGDPRVPRVGQGRRHRAGRLARQLSDQPRDAPTRRCAQQSIEAMGDEIDRAEALGLLGVVLHPGAYTVGSEADGLTLIADALLDLLRARRRGKTMVLLEHTAGQGTTLGATFEQLAVDHRQDRTTTAASASASTPATCSRRATTSARPKGYASTFAQFGRVVGFDRLKAFHLNDSKKPLGSRVDRHEHIGQGYLGLEPFRRIVNDRRFRDLPMLLETPKAEGKATGPIAIDPLDEQNLNTLRGL